MYGIVSVGFRAVPKNPEQVLGLDATPSLFRLLRVEPRIGRIFTEEEGLVGNNLKTILSYAAWQQCYAGDEGVIGRDVRLNGVLHSIVGVMPEDFYFGSRETRFYRPIAFTDDQRESIHSNNWQQIGRLRPGASMEVAQQQIDALNAANLVMVRSSVRVKELATRFALGAGRTRVTRQLLTESVLLTVTGGTAGLLIGYWGLGVLESLGIDRLPRASEITMDGTVGAATLGMALAVGLVIGVIPIVGALRTNLSSVFRDGVLRQSRLAELCVGVVAIALA